MPGINIDFKRLFYDLPTPYMVLDIQLRFIDMNEAYLAVTERTREDLLGRYVFDAFPEKGERLAMFKNAFERAVKGEANSIVKSPFAISRPAAQGGGMREVWWTCHHVPIYDNDGAIVGMLQRALDETAEVNAERMRELVSREFDHRFKNLLTTISTIARRTATSAHSTEQFLTDFDSRIGSMARNHQLLVEGGWDGMNLRNLVISELKPYLETGRNKILIEGPPILLNAKQGETLGLAIHELATNAAKYGALKEAGAKLEVSWSMDASQLAIAWSESGMDNVREPQHRGFGSVIIDRALPAELSATVKRDFLPGGMNCLITIPRASAA